MSQGILASVIHRWAPEAEVLTLVTTFRQPVIVDSSPTCRGVVTDIDEAGGAQVAEQTGGTFAMLDVSDPAAWERVVAMFDAVLTSPMLGRTARLIEEKLGRPIEPFDIWYNGFKPRGAYTEAELDALLPTLVSFVEQERGLEFQEDPDVVVLGGGIATVDEQAVAAEMRGEIARKRRGHGIDEPAFAQPDRPMSAIGG